MTSAQGVTCTIASTGNSRQLLRADAGTGDAPDCCAQQRALLSPSSSTSVIMITRACTGNQRLDPRFCGTPTNVEFCTLSLLLIVYALRARSLLR